jgi:hypothetical protein
MSRAAAAARRGATASRPPGDMLACATTSGITSDMEIVTAKSLLRG